MLTHSPRIKKRKSGQAIIFLLVVMVIGLLVVLWNYDLHNIVATKVRIDTAGDSAALSAARWQGITLNMIGELNLIQAAEICESLVDPESQDDIEIAQQRAEAISLLRSRLSLNGPLMGFVAAQSAAFMNLREKDIANREQDFSKQLMRRANRFISAGEVFDGNVSEAYPGAWFEYGSLLSSIAGNKMVVDSANTQYYHFFNGSHILLDPRFYSAIAAKHWCYFKSGARRNLIDNYTSYEDWPPLPNMANRSSVNSEYFSLKLVRYNLALRGFSAYARNSVSNYYNVSTSIDSGGEQLERYYRKELRDNFGVGSGKLPYVFDINFSWHLYNLGSWFGRWPSSKDFPFEEGVKVRDEYNYRGADAAVDCYINAKNITPGIRVDSDWIYWAAAAKPFGYLQDPDSSTKRVPFYFGVVLPCFRHSRLIHNALSSRSNGLRPAADEHFYNHLELYMKGGVDAIRGIDCWYCKQLIKWEESSFREEGSQWLEDHQEQIDKGEMCVPIRMYNGGGGGGSNGGGSPMGRG